MDKIKLILGAAIAAALVFFVMDVRHKDEIEIYIQEYKQFQAEANAANEFADSLKEEIEEAEQKAEEALELAEEYAEDIQDLEEQTDSLKQEVAIKVEELNEESTIEEALEVVQSQKIIIEQQDSTLRLKDAQIAQLFISITQKDYQINLLTESRDSLQTIIANIPPPPPNPNKAFGFIPLPSRKVSAIVGFVGGVVVASQIIG